jgi:dihydroneopterin aldolase/2-amino-4-hydroxy-6-hydroxymethyldihydropteridine diphosphokinase
VSVRRPETGPDRRPDRIELRGLRVLGRHGVLDEERARAQPFEVDLDLELDLRPAGRTDALLDTVDYGAVAESVARLVEGEHSDLLEHLADRIARTLMATTGVPGAAAAHAVTVTIRKLRPPVAVDMVSAGVSVHRRREDFE